MRSILKNVVGDHPRALQWLAGIIVVLLFVWGIVRSVSSEAAAGLLGVMIGAGAASAVQVWSIRANRRQQLRMAAIDRRLAAHQEAFQRWRELLASMHDAEKIEDVVLECQDWWEKNALYLEPDVSKAFVQAYHAAGNHLKYMNMKVDASFLMEQHDVIATLGDKIRAAVALPAITEEEREVVKPKSNAS